jgi:RimJ/RimL family protein N-acetyltransferase
MSTLPIETARLSLRLFSDADLPVLVAILGDPEVMKLALYERPLTPAEVRDFIDAEFAKSSEEIARLAVLSRNPEGDVIGFAGLIPCPYLPGELEFGFVIARQEQGKGYAKEIGLKLIEIGFGVLARERLYALCDPRNAPSRDVLSRKLQMHFVKEISTADRGLRMVFEITRPARAVPR